MAPVNKIYKYLRYPRKNSLLLKIKKRIFKFLTIVHLLNFVSLKINGKKIVIPVSSGIGLENLNMDESWMRKVIEKLGALKGGAFIDVGVNVGQTLIQWKTYDLYRPYYGFEPNPFCYRYLLNLLFRNGFQNCELFPVGLSDKNEVTGLFSNGPVDSSASIINGFRAYDHYSIKTNVAVFKGDDLLKPYVLNSISIVKIDVEGAELEVIQGLSNTIIACRPFIICEILPVYSEHTEPGRFRKQRQTEVEMFLRENRYAMYRISVEAKLSPIEYIETHSDLTLCNYLFAPIEDIDQLGI